MQHQSAAGETVNLARLARIMGVSTTTINSWLARGCPLIAEPEHGKDAQYQFDTAAVIRWRIKEAIFADRRKTAKEQG